MRFRIIFDEDLVSKKFVKSWCIIEKESSLTSDVLKEIVSMFHIQIPCHVELDGFMIPDNQHFDKIVKEGEIVNIRQGKFSLHKQPFKLDKKPANKVVKIEQHESSDSDEPRPVKSRPKPVIEESSSSSSSIKPKPKSKVPVKSLLVKQPEPEFVPKSSYNVQDFKDCRFEDLFPGDEILFATLEIREDCTPGMSDSHYGKIIEKNDDSAIINLIGDDPQKEYTKITQMEIIEEGQVDQYQISLRKNEIHQLKKKSNF